MEHFLIHFCEKIMKHSYRFPKTEKDRELGKNYRLKLPNHFFKGSMYLIMTIFGYCILKDLNYFPKSLLGKGWMPNMLIKGYPKSFYYEKTPLFNFYYMFCLSYFSADFVWLLFISARQTDFIIMLVHHICTISLIVFSYLVNYAHVGSIVLFLHVETDIFVHLTRFLIQTDVPEIFKNISGLALVFNFLYVRIYVFGNLIYVLIKYITWKGTIDSFLIIFLIFIYMMHINWAIMLVQKMIALFMGTKIVDTREYKIKNKEIKKEE
jgi:ceramide synthetase